jgi:hypothetical protein
VAQTDPWSTPNGQAMVNAWAYLQDTLQNQIPNIAQSIDNIDVSEN